MEHAPIALFVYNRPTHTRETIEALKNNLGAAESDLVIFSDAPKNSDAVAGVIAVRDYIKSVDGFRSVKIIERDQNWGLARSIIHGVTEVVRQHGRLIVLEDDIVTSSAFLTFMNLALDFYQDKQKVWHISGWNYPIKTEKLNDVFLWRVMNCWGWATWADRWKKFDKNPVRLINEFSEAHQYHFDLDGSGIFWTQIIENAEKKIDTWAIFWYATIYQNHGLCLNPSLTYADNIGIDGSGTHSGNSYSIERRKLNHSIEVNLDVKIQESSYAVEEIRVYYKSKKRPVLTRFINRLSRVILKKNIL